MDPIADFLTIIRNAYMAKKAAISLPTSKSKLALAKLLAKHGYLGAVSVKGGAPKQSLEIELLYHQKLPLVTHLKRLSRPGVRFYATADKLPRSLSGRGLTIGSTSQGLLTDRQARQKNLGGEIICQVW